MLGPIHGVKEPVSAPQSEEVKQLNLEIFNAITTGPCLSGYQASSACAFAGGSPKHLADHPARKPVRSAGTLNSLASATILL
jgi:hypothetical protein